jgi:hypothetical protein
MISRDDVPPEASHELLTDTQLAARWQLSRGTLANQRSQGRGPAYLKLAGRVRYRRAGIAPPVGIEPTTDRLEGCCSIL